ncbi:4Fe-4S binding protein [Achromobacter xylosoxidans]
MLWPQDVVYLAVLLVISALALFLFTAVAGRLFCGYACPQTVYTEIFMRIEREGRRPRRLHPPGRVALDLAQGVSKVTKHFLWIALAWWTGSTFIGYFAPIRRTGPRAVRAAAWAVAMVLDALGFYGFATWGNAGFMRESVCKYMRPYARFQSVMVDPDTFVHRDKRRGDWARRPLAQGRPQGRGAGRLRRLQPVRAGVPDRHRHPRRAAIHVHQAAAPVSTPASR